MTAVRFERRSDAYALTFTYEAFIVDVIKLTVPPYARTWSKPRREWLIEPVYGRPLADELRRQGCTIIGLDEANDGQHWARAVFQRVGPDRAPLAYRLLSRLCHPDHGGDHQLQLELNEAYAELPQRRTA